MFSAMVHPNMDSFRLPTIMGLMSHSIFEIILKNII